MRRAWQIILERGNQGLIKKTWKSRMKERKSLRNSKMLMMEKVKCPNKWKKRRLI
jgi:hypothetical protein